MFSLIVCTHNPDERLFGPVLQHLIQIATSNPEQEIVLVDNNSNPPLLERHYITTVIREFPQFRIVEESRPGLTYARLAAHRATTTEWLVFVDDDGLIAADYLSQLAHLIDQFPFVGIWGPGDITPVYIDRVSNSLKATVGPYFLERHRHHLAYGCITGLADFCPPGLGMAIRRDCMSQYSEAVNIKRFTSTDRVGNSLASAGDSQICFAAMLNGIAVGIAPSLRMTHQIPATRANSRYIIRLAYSVERSIQHALHEAWPSIYPRMDQVYPGLISTIIICLSQFIKLFFHRNLLLTRIHIAAFLGQQAGYYDICRGYLPFWIRIYSRRFI